MAIAFDSSTKDAVGGAGTSHTTSFNNVAGNFMVVTSTSYTTNPGATTMTYNGVSMTQMGSNQTGGATPVYQYTFYLASPATGTNNIVTTTTNSLTNGFFDHVLSYSGVNTASPIANNSQSTTANIGDTSVAVTIGNTGSSFAVWQFGAESGRTYTAGANTVLRAGASDAQCWSFDSNGIASSSPWTLNAVIATGTEIKLLNVFELKAQISSGFLNFM